MSQVGMGVMLGYLGGNERTVDAVKAAIGKEIASVEIQNSAALVLSFKDGSKLVLSDDGQSCCESRYMTSDGDDLSYYTGATLLGPELAEGSSAESEWGDSHDIQFLNVKTSKGVFTISNHNEHNGYYSGFWITASYTEPKGEEA